MEKDKRKFIRKRKGKYTLHDFLPKEFIEEFIEYQNCPGYKEDCEEAEEELCEIFEYFEDHLGREITKSEDKILIDVIRKYSPKDKKGEVFTFLHPETVWEVYWHDREERWGSWEKLLK